MICGKDLGGNYVCAQGSGHETLGVPHMRYEEGIKYWQTRRLLDRLEYPLKHDHGTVILSPTEARQIVEVIRAQQEQIAYLTAERDNALSAAPSVATSATTANEVWRMYAESRNASQASRRAC